MPTSPTRNVEARSRTHSGDSVSIPALARTDGVNDTDDSELVLRRRGLGLSSAFLGVLKAAYFKAIPERFVIPKQIADEIRRLRGHDRSTVYERHKNFHEEDHSCPHHDELVSLCTKLINLSYIYTLEFAAQRELSALYIEDPVLSEVFQTCEFTPKSFDISQEGDYHRRWSELLGRSSFKSNQRPETAQHSCDVLKDAFKYYKYGFIAVGYIPYAMELEMQNEDLGLMHQLWDNFLDNVVRKYLEEFHPINIVDRCFRSIVSSGKPLAYFASSSQLERMAMSLIANSTEVPFIFSTFFPPPMFEFRNPKDPYGAKLVIRSPARDWDIVSAATYAIPFLGAFARGMMTKRFVTQGKDFHALSEYIESNWSGTPLEHTVLAKGEGAFIDLYEAVNDAATSYRRSMGVLRKLEASVHHALVTLVESSLGSMVIETSSRKDKKNWDIPRGNLLIAHTVDIDRYHKREMLEDFKNNDAYIDILNDRLRFQTYLRRPDGICNLTYIPQFRNVSYLRRFRIGNEYFITADGLPESSNQILNYWNRAVFPEDIVVDTMQLDGKILTCLWVAESSVFNCTGHYPILAGVDFETNEPLFVAVVYRRVNSPWYFTTVKDGASSVTFMDEIGVKCRSRKFFVLCLRHDPIDLPPQDIQHREGAKDPTGPVYWVEFWPKKDAHYFYDERLRDDRLLESFLNEQRIMGTILGGFY
ncbi:hypothetical protein SCHPADRAFT_943348 [Schizopora paradoxa]|uniref:Uncharacterized protein n=1 Tax=Schizopora paradoxa TaxID=27342 RepID=A0A0H2RD52_9AGAM|nr:hypothetical protein SCHPADRAFT_943348 [Schizopora paradoxa]